MGNAELSHQVIVAALSTLDFCLTKAMKSSLGTRALSQKGALCISTTRLSHLVALVVIWVE